MCGKYASMVQKVQIGGEPAWINHGSASETPFFLRRKNPKSTIDIRRQNERTHTKQQWRHIDDKCI